MIKDLNIQEQTKRIEWDWKKFEMSTWNLAPLSDWAVVISLWGCSILVTAVINKEPQEDKDFLPLTVDCRESFYAWWKIWWAAYIRREWRPSDRTILISRITDRCIRPMLPDWMINDIVITITPLSVDKENSLWVPSIIWASVAMKLAGIPFEWPIWAVKIWYKDWKYIINPTYEEIEQWLLELTIAWQKDNLTMVECSGKEVPNDILIEAFKIWQKEIEQNCNLQEEFLKNFNIEEKTVSINKPSENLINHIKENIDIEELQGFMSCNKKQFQEKYKKLQQKVFEHLDEKIQENQESEFTNTKVKMAVSQIIKEFIREKILNESKRLDWRGLDDIRPINCQVWLEDTRIHWTWLFQRWETQVLSATTLWAPWDVLLVDDMESDWEEKRFMHHYNMPAFATNEARWWRPANRREIWHGKLVEKAIKPILPKEEDFSYAIRVVSEVLSSNWSSSMASVCATILSLMDAGVPITSPVSWIAMWLITDWKKHQILTDIQWVEDFLGDMDFKVAWTQTWITALQMDMKVKWLDFDILEKAINKANEAREKILQHMLKTMPKPRENMSIYAPRILNMKFEPSQVREIIWSGWSNINEIVRQTWVKIDFKDDWTTVITSKDLESEKMAVDMIKETIWTPEVWQVIQWTITRVEQYWVFVDIGKNKVGLCHVKNLGRWFVSDPKTLYKEWDKITVKVMWINTNDWKIELKKEE